MIRKFQKQRHFFQFDKPTPRKLSVSVLNFFLNYRLGFVMKADSAKLRARVDEAQLELRTAKTKLEEYFKKDNFRRAQAVKLLETVTEKGTEALLAIDDLKSSDIPAKQKLYLEKLTDEIAKSKNKWVAKARAACEGGSVEPVASETLENRLSAAREETDDQHHVVDQVDATERNDPDTPDGNNTSNEVVVENVRDRHKTKGPIDFHAGQSIKKMADLESKRSKKSAEKHALSHRSKRTSAKSSLRSLTASERKQEAKAAKLRLEELNRRRDEELRMEEEKREHEKQKLIRKMQLEDLERQNKFAEAEETKKIALAKIHEENRRKIEEPKIEALFFEEDENDADTLNDDLGHIPEDPKNEQTDRWLQNLDTSDQAENLPHKSKTDIKDSVRFTGTNRALNVNAASFVPQKPKSLRFCRHEDNELPNSWNFQEPIGEPTVSLSDLVKLLANNRRDPLPEWKLDKFDGDPMQWHEWYGQFRSAIDSGSMSNDVKLTYLKTLVTGKAKCAIAEFAYCGEMYEDALATLKRKFGQPQTVVCAYLEKLGKYPPVKMHNSESLIKYSEVISSIVGVFRSLGYDHDLKSASLVNQAISKLPPNLKESWHFHTVKSKLEKPTFVNFSSWLQDRAEAHDRMQHGILNFKTSETSSSKPKTANAKNFVVSSSKEKPDPAPTACPMCKQKHHLYQCSAFKAKTATDRAKFAASIKYCFSCLNGEHSFRDCSRGFKCAQKDCKSSHHTLLHGAEKVFPKKNSPKKPEQSKDDQEKRSSQNHSSVTESTTSLAKLSGLLPIIEVVASSPSGKVKTVALCDSGSSHSWISQSLANKLQLSGKPQTIALNAFLGTQLLQTECVDLQITGESDSFKIQVLTKDSIDVGRDSINFPALKTKFDHLGVLPDSIFSYANVELVLGQTALFCTRPLEYKISGKLSPVAIRMPLGWTVGGPLPQREFQKASSFLVTSQNADLAELASQWWSLESYGSNKSVDPRSEADARAETILQQSTYRDGERYVVGML